MIIDVHCHVGKSIYGDEQSPSELLAVMDDCNIDMSVICGFTPPSLNFRTENNRIAKLIKKCPDRFIGFARVDPRLGNKAVEELERAVKTLGFKGVKVHPMEQAFRINDEFMYPLMLKAANLGVPVMVESGYPLVSSAIQVGDLAKDFRSVKIIMTHGGQLDTSGMGYFDALSTIKENMNIIVETSGIVVTCEEGFIKEIVDGVGAEKIIFGSNSPFMHPKLELERIQVAAITPRERALILGENIAKLLFKAGSN